MSFKVFLVSVFFVNSLFAGVSFAENKVFLIPTIKNEVAVGDAIAENILEGKTYSSDEGLELTGTMPDIGAVDITPVTSDQVIPPGYHDGNGKVKGDPDLVSSNILAGRSLFGKVGTGECLNSDTQNELFHACQAECFLVYLGNEEAAGYCAWGCQNMVQQFNWFPHLSCRELK